LLKKRILQVYPKLATLPTSEALLKKLCEAAIRVWLDFNIDLVNKLINSIVNRVKAVKEAKGWYTKY